MISVRLVINCLHFSLSMRSVDFVTLSIFLFSVMYFWLLKTYRGMSRICPVTNLLFLRKTTLAVLEVEYVDRGHYSVALASTFSGHCIQRQKKNMQTKLFLCRTEIFLFAWRREQGLQQKTQQCCVGRSCM